MEKNSLLVLTQDEVAAIRRGEVPTRLLDEFGSDPTRLQELVRNGEYRTHT